MRAWTCSEKETRFLVTGDASSLPSVEQAEGDADAADNSLAAWCSAMTFSICAAICSSKCSSNGSSIGGRVGGCCGVGFALMVEEKSSEMDRDSTILVGIRLWWFRGSGVDDESDDDPPPPQLCDCCWLISSAAVLGFFRMLFSGGIVAARARRAASRSSKGGAAAPSLIWRCIGCGCAWAEQRLMLGLLLELLLLPMAEETDGGEEDDWDCWC